jgi:hypothetical protein
MIEGLPKMLIFAISLIFVVACFYGCGCGAARAHGLSGMGGP